MSSVLLSFPVIPSLIISSLITLSVYMIDSADPENYIDKMYYLKVFIVSFISSNIVIYCYYHMKTLDITPPSTSPLIKKTLEKVDFSKLTQNDAIQIGGENAPEIVANLPDF